MYRKWMSLVLIFVLLLAGSAYGAAPTYVAAGSVMQSTGAISVPWPTHQAGDVALLVVESANQTISLSTPAGFAEVTNSPQGTGTAGGTSATRLAVYWKRATTSAESTPTVADSGDHQIARIFTFRGVIDSGNPWDVTAGNVASTASTSVSIPGATTTVADTRVAVIVSNAKDTTTAQTSGVTNANLTGLAMCKDNNTTQGNGGGFGIWSGVKAAAGAYGTTTATLANSSVQGRMSIALKPVSGVPVANNGFETPNVTGYQYEPTGSSWDHSGGTGYVIADSGSVFGNTAYAGSQNMIMQGAVTVYQALSGFEVGHSYQVSWAEADRPTYGGNTLRVLMDSTVIEALHTVTNDSWVVQTSDTFVATATTHTLKFDATNTPGGDHSVFIDAVTIAEVGGSAPGAASGPSPANSATGVAVNADLSWTAGSGATSHNVYFGTTSPGTSRGNQTATTYDTGTMPNNTVHYWRIDEVNAYGTTTGTVWSFTTVVAAPGAASNPSPANSATSVSLTADLSWTAGSGATSHNVYFGTTSPGTSRGNQTATTYDTGTMPAGTVHYWRIDEVNAGGTTTGTVWSFTTGSVPGAASSPSPANGATSVSLTADLSWTAGSGATSHNVYFGTTSPGASQGNQAGTTFDTGTMTAGTVYYWRIDEVNAYGTTTGTVWSFTTGSVPGAASGPSPANGATSVAITADLSWTAGSGAASHNVYFGTTSPGASQGNQAGTTFDTGTMTNNTIYYWRIDEVNAYGTTTGTVWNFTTVVAAPGAASNPSPANSATSVSITADLSWTAGSGATSHNVYFGTTSPGASQGNQTATTYDTGTMTNSTVYYWRIDEVNAGGTTTGAVWSFTTVAGGSAPGAASNPSPASGATSVSLTADLSWTAGSGATSHNVYFGTASPGASQGNQTATTFDTGTMTAGTVYYWRIDEVNAYGTTTGTAWSFTTGAVPGAASGPSPSSGATGVSITADLSWTAGSGATSRNVYFGTTSPGASQGNQTATTFDTGTMTNNTIYYWRIDEVNAYGTTTGTVWSFTTIVAAPGAASNPSPANSATSVAITADLSWTAGSGATSHNVYFGTTSPGTSRGNQTATTYDTGTMPNGTVHYWRIDEVNAGGTTTGTVWSFTTVAAAPGAASNPSPANSATDVSVDAYLSWTAGSGATSHNVYFGTSSPGTSQGNQTAVTFNPGTMDEDTTYYWRIDEVNASGTTTGTVWNFTTETGLPLVISNTSPATYTTQYDSLAVGQLVYIDRTYTFSNVASLGGSTYIKTANDDKSSTVASFLTFDINQDCTVYVAHDDVITTKPGWMSTWTDTGSNLLTSNGATHSLYYKDFNTGTVTLGGNAGGVSSSMYSVVVVGKGTITSYDMYSDTWVAVDALGRALPDYDDCGAPRSDRYVALFYFLWLGEHGTGGPYDITDILAANPTNPAYGPGGVFPTSGAPHHWGESELGYYLSDDEYVMRKHAYMLANAGVDVIVFDITNAYTYTSNYLTLCSVFMDIRADGGTTPKIAFMAYAYADDAVESVYDNLYSEGLYTDLWFYWKGKPLILAPLNGQVILGRTITYSTEIQNFFNMRHTWAWTAGYDTWNWIDDYPQDYGWHESSSIPEEISVCAGHHANSNKGRSYHDGSQPSYNQYKLTGYEHLGLNLDEQWSRLDAIDPEIVFITGWNEWVAGRYIVPDGQEFPFLGNMIGPGGTFFVDTYNQEYSRDIEPMKGLHTDNYYYQMIDGIRRYKGVRDLPTPSTAKTITIDGSFADWDSVSPEYRDWVGDTLHRSSTGWGSAGTYTNTTGRNDFITAKVARDASYVYFYVETDEAITAYTGSNWMMLFINSNQTYTDGWQGYDYVVNMAVTSSTITTLKGTSSGWNWTNVNTNIAYRVSGNKMEIRVPRSDIGQGSGENTVAFDFHWADNIQANDDIIQFAVSGDSAPDRRFNYRYVAEGSGGSVPGAASNPSPADDATAVSVTADLSWTAGSGAVSHNVYFGTDSTPDSGEYKGNQSGTTYDTGTMANSTTYYWRIDEVNAYGTTTGTVWNFTTAADVDLVISSVSPATYTVQYDSLATGQLMYIDRTYTFTNVASLGGSTYIKTANADKSTTTVPWLTFNINQDCTVYVAHDDVITSKPSWMSTWSDTGENLVTNSPATFSLYSKVFSTGAVSIGGNAGGVSSSMYGVVVVPIGTSAPDPATNPSPASGATNVWIDSNLSWTTGSGAASHNVYFGQDSTPDSGEFMGNQSGTTYEPGTMSINTTYYWRIDEVNANGTTTGTVWSFTTGDDAGLAISSNGHWIEYNGTTSLLIGDSLTQGWMELGTNFPQEDYIDALAGRGINILMIWSYIGIVDQVADSRIGYNAPEIWPWQQSSGVFDLNSFNTAYFTRLENLVASANNNNMAVLITIHDGWTKDRFSGHPFNTSKGGPLTDKAQYVELYDYNNEMGTTYNPSWTRQQKNQFYQERYVNSLINAVGDYPNVILEIFNEGEWYNQTNLRAHQVHFLNYIKARTDTLTMVNDDHVSGDNFRGVSNCDIISYHKPNWDSSTSAFTGFDYYDGEFWGSPAKPYYFGEPVPEYQGDSGEHDALMRLMWGTAVAGAGFVVQNDASWGFDTNTNMADQAADRDVVLNREGYCCTFFNESVTNLGLMGPNGSLSSSTVCLAYAGTEYVAYSQSGSSFTVNLSAASGKTMNCRFYNPRTGAFNSTFQRSGGSSAESFTKPDSNDWVLHIIAQ